MKLLVPLLIALLGLGAGVGAGLALKPASEPEVEEACAGAEEQGSTAVDPAAAAPCPEPDPLTAQGHDADAPEHDVAFVPIEKPFVIPVFDGEKVIAMVVVSLAVEVESHSETMVEAVEPRLRDSFLAVMFRHANSGGFDGTFTEGQPMDDLRSGLLAAARDVITDTKVSEVLITEIARQEV